MSDECTCHISPPCDFCTSLTEEEVGAYASGGIHAVLKMRRDKSNPFAPPTADWIPPGDHFVLVVENDSWDQRNFTCDQYGIPVPLHPGMPSGPITWEHYIGKGTALEAVRANRSHRYGRTAIARLVFVEVEQ